MAAIKKGNIKKKAEATSKHLNNDANKPLLSDFFGKMKGKFGDGLVFQKTIRNTWGN